jgi:histone H3/H4
MQRKIIPKAPIARIVLNSGARRVSEDAIKALTEIVEELSLKIGARAVEIAKHSGRKTVHESDIKLAAKN